MVYLSLSRRRVEKGGEEDREEEDWR